MKDLTSLNLRPYQIQAVNGLRSALKTGLRRLILSSPTGSGKTEMGFEIIRGAQEKGKKVAFVANRVHLVDQTCRRLSRAGFEYGVIQGENTKSPWASILVCSIQSVVSRGLPDDVDLLVIDEAHACAGTEAYREVMKGRFVVGLTATPYSKGLGKHYSDLGGPLFQMMVTAARIQDLITDGYLVSADVWAPGEPDLKGVRITAGDYNEKELGEAVNKSELVGDIVAHWFKLAFNTSTVVFATNIAHSKHIVSQFESAGIPAEHIDCYTSDDDRQAILKRVESRETMVLSNVGILAEGWDFPACRTLILARPTRSLIRYLQMAGRVLRPYPGKEKACLVKGTLILTDSGLVPIDKISLDHKIWDGISFVSHGGAICQGVKSVISYAGITGTPDHLIRTQNGWETLAEAHRRQSRVAIAGYGRSPIRFSDDNIAENQRVYVESVGSRQMRTLPDGPHEQIPQYQKTAPNHCMSTLQSESARQNTEMDLCQSTGAAPAMQQSQVQRIQELRWTRNTVQIQECEPSSSLGCRTFGNPRGQNATVGPDRQRQTLRAGQFEMVDGIPEHGAYPDEAPGRENAQIQTGPSRDQICGRYTQESHWDGSYARTDCGEILPPLVQTEGEVWDILNCGPLHRYTANNVLVHNCILDHSGTVRRIGFPWDYFGQHLDDGTPKKGGSEERKAESLPKECPSCKFMKDPKTPVCPSCGFESKRKSEVESVEGELVPLTKRTKNPAQKLIQDMGKPVIYGMLCQLAKEWDKGEKWIVANYKEIFGTWPRQEVHFIQPCPELLSWLHSKRIAWAKSHRRAA